MTRWLWNSLKVSITIASQHIYSHSRTKVKIFHFPGSGEFMSLTVSWEPLSSLLLKTSRLISEPEFLIFFSGKYGAEGHLDEDNFSKRHDHDAFRLHLARCVKENRTSLVVTHHEKKYDGHYPFWVIIEFFSLGMLSYFYSDLLRDDKKTIAKALGCKSDDKLESWLRCLTDLRNRCAHYSRLYYWNFTSIPLLYREDKVENQRSLYAYLIMLEHLSGDAYVWKTEFRPQFYALVHEYSEDIDFKHIGLPENWACHTLW